MDKIKSLKIVEITLSGFRSFYEETTIQADDVTLIKGDNGKGKSSIAHAIAYAFYGVSAFGVQDIGNIMSINSATVKVSVKFIDNNGETHSLCRERTGGTTSLFLDGHKVLQKQIESIFVEKDIFLSLFNPSYFIEVLGASGKQMLEIKLPVIKKEDVLAKLTKHENELLKDEDLTVPDSRLQALRKENKELDNKILNLEGQIEGYDETMKNVKEQKAEFLSELDEINDKISSLTDRQFVDIDIEGLNAEKALIEATIKQELDMGGDEIQKLAERLYEAKNRVYVSKFLETEAELKGELKILSEDFNSLKSLSEIKPGDCCPLCLTETSPENSDRMKAGFKKRLAEVGARGKETKQKLFDVAELEKKAHETFFEFQRADIQNTAARYNDLKQKDGSGGKLYTRLEEIKELLISGNLSDSEMETLNFLNTEKIGVEFQIEALKVQEHKESCEMLLAKKTQLLSKISLNSEKIKAVQEYMAKRSEIALSVLDMPNVTVKFHEFVKSTGELKNCFKFLYKGFEYPTLSLSEKIKAGLEVTAMLRRLYGLEFPVFIDNSESIGNLSACPLPAQTFIMRYVKGSEFNVTNSSTRTRDNCGTQDKNTVQAA